MLRLTEIQKELLRDYKRLNLGILCREDKLLLYMAIYGVYMHYILKGTPYQYGVAMFLLGLWLFAYLYIAYMYFRLGKRERLSWIGYMKSLSGVRFTEEAGSFEIQFEDLILSYEKVSQNESSFYYRLKEASKDINAKDLIVVKTLLYYWYDKYYKEFGEMSLYIDGEEVITKEDIAFMNAYDNMTLNRGVMYKLVRGAVEMWE